MPHLGYRSFCPPLIVGFPKGYNVIGARGPICNAHGHGRTQDVAPDPTAVDLLDTIQQAMPTTGKQEFWTYIGEYNEQTHSFRNTPNFVVTAPPAAGATIVSAQDVYMRDAKPYQDAKGTWQLGAIKGVVPKGKALTVLDTAKIEGANERDYNSWVRVRPQ